MSFTEVLRAAPLLRVSVLKLFSRITERTRVRRNESLIVV